MTSSTTKGKIEQIRVMPFPPDGYTIYDGVIFLEKRIMELENKLYIVIDRLNELERTKHG